MLAGDMAKLTRGLWGGANGCLIVAHCKRLVGAAISVERKMKKKQRDGFTCDPYPLIDMWAPWLTLLMILNFIDSYWLNHFYQTQNMDGPIHINQT